MSSETSLADAGVRAIKTGKYAEGIANLTKALKTRGAPLWHLERSKAHLRMNQFEHALYDAEMALRIAFDRANRHQMADAQIRRAITFFRMGRVAEADVCAFWAMRLADGARAMEDDGQQRKVDGNGDYIVRLAEVEAEGKPKTDAAMNTALNSKSIRTKEFSLRNQAFTWRIQALTQMDKLPAGHDGRKLHALVKYPELSQIPIPNEIPPSTSQDSSAAATSGGAPKDETAGIAGVPDATSSIDTWEQLWTQYHTLYTKHKIRFNFYQSNNNVTVSIFLKNLTKEQVALDSQEQAVKLSALGGASFGSFGDSITLLLFDKIQPEVTKWRVTPTQIELILQKQKLGRWPTLRPENAEIVDNLTLNPNTGISFKQFMDLVTALGYNDPSELELPSLHKDPSAWYTALLDKLRSRLEVRHGSSTPATIGPSISSGSIKQSAEKAVPASAPAYPTSSKKGAKNWDKIDDGDNEDTEKNADVNSFFQQIYKDSDEDTKRAMMKSFIESNGTALSTSWNDAKSKTYQTQPPDGVEAKKWE
ncbi:SGS domain-containing protein [Nemania serpens]|nr:SGS domain-containing protein [Nemania serpens]